MAHATTVVVDVWEVVYVLRRSHLYL